MLGKPFCAPSNNLASINGTPPDTPAPAAMEVTTE